MLSKRILGIAGAAMIGTLAGTGAVHAALSMDYSGLRGGVGGIAYAKSITFAQETLRSDRKVTATSGDTATTYYEAAAHTSNSTELDVNVPIQVLLPANSGAAAVVTVTLDHLVFTGIASTLTVTTAATPGVAVSNVTTSLVSGGGAGDRQAQYQITVGATMVPATSRLLLELERIGVDPDNEGSITITTNREIAGVPIAESTSLPGAVKTAYALNVASGATKQTASVEEMFQKFVATDASGGMEEDGVASDQLAANVGHLHIGIATTTNTYLNLFHNAGRGDVTSGTVTEASHLVSESSIVFTGDTSFLANVGEGDDAKKNVYVTTQKDCDPATSSIQDDDGMLKASLDDFDGYTGTPGMTSGASARTAVPGYLCLKVDGETAIPGTEAYGATVTHTAALGANAAFLSPSSTHTLGSIERDGSTVRIAYLTTNQKYNQRLVLVNRTTGPVEYSMTFQTAAGTTATARDAASGMLQPGRTVLMVRDIVEFAVTGRDAGGHGSAEIAVVAARNVIDAATVITNRDDGSTDTVVLDTL